MTRQPAQTGSILVELLVVIVILSVVMIGMVGSFGNIFRGQVKADKRLEATQYAIEGMEAVYNLSRNDDPGGSPGWSSVLSGLMGATHVHVDRTEPNYFGMFWDDSPNPQLIDGGFKRSLSVFEADPSMPGLLILVTSEVCWEEGCDVNDPAKIVSFSSYFAKRP